jgi:hypothetical protein
MSKSRNRIGVRIGLGLLSLIPPVVALVICHGLLSETIKYNYSIFSFVMVFGLIFFIVGAPVLVFSATKYSSKHVKLWIVFLITLLVSGLIFLGMYLPLKNSIKPGFFTDTSDKLFAPACKGQPVKGVSDYQPLHGSHPIVILQNDRSSLRRIPDEWMPKSLEEIELVACVGKEEKVLMETCHYESGGKVKRYQYQVTIQLVAASTGQVLKNIKVQGSPEYCAVSVQGSAAGTIEGGYVLTADLTNALSSWVFP